MHTHEVLGHQVRVQSIVDRPRPTRRHGRCGPWTVDRGRRDGHVTKHPAFVLGESVRTATHTCMFGKPAHASNQSLKVTVTDSGPCEKSLRVEVAAELVQPVRAQVMKEFQKQAKLDGYRPGKAPAELVLQRFGQRIQEETVQRVMQQTFTQVAKDRGLRPVGPFEVRRAEMTNGQTLLLFRPGNFPRFDKELPLLFSLAT